jgi:nitric oxide dioxygenase
VLSERSKPYIDASVPVLKSHGLAITQTFYRDMFADRPDLTNLFNMGNQANGSQQQSLASAVFAYAANHDNGAALAPVLNRIAHKHAAVGLKPSHYPIVARHLLGAIASVLGEAATPELLAAWDEAYWLLAGELIAAESRLYTRNASGPEHRQPMRVTRRQEQSEDVVAFTLAPADGSKPADFQPGQYISVVAELSPGVFQQRQYSLSDAPNGTSWRISVKRSRADAGNPAGTVSNWLHDHVRAGDVVLTSQPYGDFAPAVQASTPLVLLSAGIGITPMMAVVKTLARDRSARRIVFGHAARSQAHLSHQDDLAEAAGRLPGLTVHVFLESAEPSSHAGHAVLPGRMNAAALLTAADRTDADIYLCGPLPFMREQRQALVTAGIPETRIHREVFGPEMLDTLE